MNDHHMTETENRFLYGAGSDYDAHQLKNPVALNLVILQLA
ncbi:hypothetical protein [Undibacterium sp. TJN19]